jgi:hypothetical protein
MSAKIPSTPLIEIYAQSNLGHLQQLYTGFSALHAAKRIKLVQRLKKRPSLRTSIDPHLRDARMAHCTVIINGTYRVYYDMHDSWEIDDEALSSHDFYFKRSFYPNKFPNDFIGLHKIRPYGLNYEIVANPIDWFALHRSLLSKNAREFLTGMGWATGLAHLWQFIPKLQSMQASAPEEDLGTVLFMARTWDPNQDSVDIDSQRQSDRDSINQMRATCIRALRESFGEKFTGGFAPTDHAKKNYPDLILSNDSYARKNYIGLLRKNTICVATAGLHGSIGWKMAEYVAFSRSIVSEEIGVKLPGDFIDGANYLSFRTPNECVEQVRRLMVDADLRHRMMQYNHEYYLKNLHPISIVENTVREVFNTADSNPKCKTPSL